MRKNPLFVPEIREYLSGKDIEPIRAFCAAVGNAAVVAEYLLPLEQNEIWEALKRLSPNLRGEIFSHFPMEVQLEIAENLGRRDIANLVNDMPPDDRVDLYKRLPEETQERLLPALAQAEREDIRRLAAYPEGTAGSVMTSEYATLPPGIPVSEALRMLRLEAPDKETIFNAYVIDKSRMLLGDISLKDLILAHPRQSIDTLIRREVPRVLVTDNREAAARTIQKYDLIALPVVNEEGVLLGIITHDDAIDIITQAQTEDLEKIMAIGGTHEVVDYLGTTSFSQFKKRVGWLVILAILGFISGYIIQSFEGILSQFIILALFLPMVADTGGNTGSQAATIVIRALALEQIRVGDILQVLFKEFKTACMLSLVLSLLAFGRVLLFTRETHLPEGYPLTRIGMAIAAALGLQVISSTLIGALLPMTVFAFKKDPAVVASPALTTMVDITGLLIYFFTARFFLGI